LVRLVKVEHVATSDVDAIGHCDKWKASRSVSEQGF